VFTLGTEHYALPIQQVHEIIRYSDPRSVASRADWVRGVISLRGRIVPVYDLAARPGVPSELTEHTKIVIVEAGAETAGVIVDGVEEVLTVQDEQMQDATTLLDGSAGGARATGPLAPWKERSDE
jgi:purine-binding chemotaxis protein CheW